MRKYHSKFFKKSTIILFLITGLAFSVGTVGNFLDAEALCGKTCRAAEAEGLTVKEYLEKYSGDSTTKSTKSLETQEKDWEDLQKSRNFISIVVSESCQISGTCPDYKTLADLFDNSNRFLSGDFIFNNDTGRWERDEPRRFNVFELYRYMNLPWVVFVDPDDYTWDRSKQIIITSQLRYLDSRDTFENQVRTEYVGLHLDGCTKATIGWKNDDGTNGADILLDVLNYFYSKCRGEMTYEPKREIFVDSKVFTDCDRECFYHREQLKKEMKVDFEITEERWVEKHCRDDDEDPFTKLTSYQFNKEECDRVKVNLGLEVDDDDEPCYGIYCDNETSDNSDKTAFQLKQQKLREMEEIDQCKEEQIWDDKKREGDYRRLSYDCEDEDQRQDYLDIIACEETYDLDVDCYDEDERNAKLKEVEAKK